MFRISLSLSADDENLEEDSDDDQTDRKKIKQDTSGRIGKLIIVNDGDSNNNGTKDHQDNVDGASSLIGEFGSVSLSHSNTNPNPPVPTFNLSWNISALRLWSNSTGPYRILSPGSFSGTSLGIAASGGTASFIVEGLQGSSAPGDQIVTVAQGDLRAEVRFTVLKGDFNISVNGVTTSDDEETDQTKTVLKTFGTDIVRLTVPSLMPLLSDGYFTISGDKDYELWTVDSVTGDEKTYDENSQIPNAGLPNLLFETIDIGIHTLSLMYHPIGKPPIVVDTIKLFQRNGAYAINDDFSITYEGPNTPWKYNIRDNDHVGDNDDRGTITLDANTNTHKGSFILNDDGLFVYTPGENQYGEDAFTYTMVNAYGESSTATINVFIEVEPIVKKVRIDELDPDSQAVLRDRYQQFLRDTAVSMLGPTLGASFAERHGTNALEQLVKIAGWGWTIAGPLPPNHLPPVPTNDDLIESDSVPRKIWYPRYGTFTQTPGWVQNVPQTVDHIKNLIFEREVTEHRTAYDRTGGNPYVAGIETFVAHRNTRIAVGAAVIVLAAPAVIGGVATFTVASAGGITIGGITQAGVVVGSSWAIVRAANDIHQTIYDEDGSDRSLLESALDNTISKFLAQDAPELTNNLLTSIDIATFVVEVGPGFVSVIRGKRVFTQTPVPPKPARLEVLYEYCFSPETKVDTPEGKRRIDEIGPGDQVHAFDFSTGAWVASLVVDTHKSRYRGAFVTLYTEGGTVGSTAYHPFWVIDGHQLASRQRPKELRVDEDEGESLQGRWVNSHDLMAGDILISADGRRTRLLRIEQHFEDDYLVCNLSVENSHNFAVGFDGLLVHNTSGCGVFGSPIQPSQPHISPITGRVVNLDGRIRHVKLAKHDTRFTPLTDKGGPVKAGMKHVEDGHFGFKNTQSQFTVSVEELKQVLQSKIVRDAPMKQIGTGRQAQWYRDVDVGRIMGVTKKAHGALPTSRIRVFVDEIGNLITTFTIP
jgi:hypothetical protein